jgi:hypothetical protein
MNITTQITNKQLDFISDVDLRTALLERLQELDRVFLVNANYSTIFIALGAIEGIFKYIASLYKDDIRSSPSYPMNPKGTKKRFDRLYIDELYFELKNLSILPDIPEYKTLYQLFRQYRNFIHPDAQVRKGWEIEVGQAQLALGLLNATIQNLDRNIFIGKHIFEKVSGNPIYDSRNILRLESGGTPHNSFIVLNQSITEKLTIAFELDLPYHSLLNFVYNFLEEGDFKMVRLDNRRNSAYPNAVLRSSQKYSWNYYLDVYPPLLSEKENFSVRIEIDLTQRKFEFIVDGKSYKFSKKHGKDIDLINEIEPNRKLGFFNELGPVKLSNLNIEIT